MKAWELALESWVDCRPQGYVLEERMVRARLPNIAARVPGTRPGQFEGEGAVDLWEIFAPTSKTQEPVFLTLLRPQSGKVHFLYFWKAFGEAMHMAQAGGSDGLVAELETLRDRLLRRLEEKACAASPSSEPDGGISNSSSSSSFCPRPVGEAPILPTSALVEEVHSAGAMSAHPKFWQRCAWSLRKQIEAGEFQELSLEELTSVFLAWLHDSQLWEQQQKEEMRSQAEQGQQVGRGVLGGVFACFSRRQEEGLPVFLHIYDVSQEEGIQKLNRMLAHQNSWVKFGGIFHAGVEVNGLEYSYGFSPCESQPGVSAALPKTHPQHHYRQTVVLRRTRLSAEDVADIISFLIDEYPGPDYDLLRRNCCHFADDFCRRIGVGGLPGWVFRLSRLGAGLESIWQRAPQGLKEQFLLV